jgi:methylenetetrahydrofolate dehydrogenase (NADP+) / methenyltetrahydrofolate cyclohydrolase
MSLLLDGRAAAERWKRQLKEEISSFGAEGKPSLTVIIVGEHPASTTYVRHKQKACAEVGIRSALLHYPSSVREDELLNCIKDLNGDPSVHGILVQLPLPAEVNADRVLSAVDPTKDVDGFHPYNLGQLVTGGRGFVPCTPLGIQRLLADYQISLAKQKVVIVGRSRIVGKPLALLWSQKRDGGSPTVTLAHSETPDLPAVCRDADILVIAAGRHRLVQQEWVRPGAVVVDVGIHTIFDSLGARRLEGDVQMESVSKICRAYTPVPGGVGPMTVAALLQNSWTAYQLLRP